MLQTQNYSNFYHLAPEPRFQTETWISRSFEAISTHNTR